MKTWTFVAEILVLFLGLCLCPQSDTHTRDTKQRKLHYTYIVEQDNLLTRWYFSALTRPPPPGS